MVAGGQSQPDVSTTLNYANGILYGVDRSPVTSSYSRSQVCEERSRSFGGGFSELTDTDPTYSAAFSPSQAEDSQDFFSDDDRARYQPCVRKIKVNPDNRKTTTGETVRS